jgi:hypothetical protein
MIAEALLRTGNLIIKINKQFPTQKFHAFLKGNYFISKSENCRWSLMFRPAYTFPVYVTDILKGTFAA